MTHKIAILGASGYTGAELVRLIATHPTMEIVALSGDRKAGHGDGRGVSASCATWPCRTCVKIEEIDFSGVDLAFCALPHATSQAVISELPRDLKIVDLSADFRLRDPAEYREMVRQAPCRARIAERGGLWPDRVLPRRDRAPRGWSPAPGCNAATGQFALRPLIEAGVIDLDDIIIDLKAGVSGAGRRAEGKPAPCRAVRGVPTPMRPAARTGIWASSIRNSRKAAGRPVQVQFTPHLIPANRGILATVYVKGDAAGGA